MAALIDYRIESADRETGKIYTVKITAESEQQAREKAARAGHLAGAVRLFDDDDERARQEAEHSRAEQARRSVVKSADRFWAGHATNPIGAILLTLAGFFLAVFALFYKLTAESARDISELNIRQNVLIFGCSLMLCGSISLAVVRLGRNLSTWIRAVHTKLERGETRHESKD